MMRTNRYLASDEFLELREAGRAIAEPLEYSAAGSYGVSNYGEENEEGIHLREYLRRLRRHKWLIISLVVIVTSIATVYAYQIKPWYVATAVLEIGKDNSVVIKSGELTLNSDSDSDLDINTKILAFQNPKLFENVADELKLAQNERILIGFQKKPFFSFLTPSTSQPPLVLSRDPAEDEKLKLALLGGYINQCVTVEPIKNTRALKISCRDEDPETAGKVANSVARLFKDTSFETQTEKFTSSVSWLDTSTRELKAQVQKAEEALDEYGRNNQIYAIGGGTADSKGSTLTSANLTQLNDQYMRARTELILKRSLYQQVQAGRLEELPEAFSDPKVTALQGQIDGLDRQLAELQVNFGPSNPKIKEIQSQLPVLTKQLESSRQALELKLKAEYERVFQNERTLFAALNQSKSQSASENQASIKLNILKQDVDTTRNLYTDFLRDTNEAKTRVAEQNNNIKFIQEAQTPGAPVGPNRLTLILTAFALSLGAGIGLALFLEYLDNTIKSVDDVDQYVMLPTLGIVPSIGSLGSRKKLLKPKKERKAIASNEDGSQLGLELRENLAQADLVASLDNHSMFGEAYRGLRTSLLLSTAGNAPKTILITSGQSSEGKTTTAVNTAVSLAQLGAKVLVIDCDLRRPTVHKRFDISSAYGLTNYLTSDTDLAGTIQELDIPNLSAMPSGPIPPNPAELLSSRKMRDMLDVLKNAYDHIILDSPPVVNVTDPLILSTIADGTVLVIQSGKTTREVVKRARQELAGVNAKLIGVVLNNVNIRKDGYDYYSYHRYAGYSESGVA